MILYDKFVKKTQKTEYLGRLKRYQNNLSSFKSEVSRLSAQEKVNERRRWIAHHGIPAEPAQTKLVKDFMTNRAGAVADNEKEILKVKNGIIKLKLELGRSSTTENRKSQLRGQIIQAEKKIASLQAYIDSGDQKVTEYKKALSDWHTKYDYRLSEIDKGINEIFSLNYFSKYLVGYFNAGAKILSDRKAKNEKIREEKNKYVPTPQDKIKLAEIYEEAKTEAYSKQVVEKFVKPVNKEKSTNLSERGQEKAVEEEIKKAAEKKAELIKDIKFALIKANIKQQEEFKNINKFKLFVDYLGENSYKTLQNLYEPLKKAGDKNADSVWAYLRTQDQGLASTVFQLAGNTAGGTAGFVGTATGGAIAEIIKAVGWDDELTELSNKFLGTGAGQALIEAISKGEAGMAWLEKNYPEAARNAKALLGAAEFATMFVGASTAKNLAKKSVVSLKFNLKLIKANIQKIKLKAANVKAVIDREVQWYIDEFQNLNYAFEGVTPNGQRFALKIKGKDLENYDFKTNIQKSVGSGSGGKVVPSLTNTKARIWYNNEIKKINTNVALTKENAQKISKERNDIKQKARDLMLDRDKVKDLDKDFPIQDFKFYENKYLKEGYKGEKLWERIIKGAKTPNSEVNSNFNI